MDPTNYLIVIDLAAILIFVYYLDRNVFHALGLVLSGLPTKISELWFRWSISIRLWLDQKALNRRGPVGRLWNEYTLWRIQHNPAYRDFFHPDNKT